MRKFLLSIFILAFFSKTQAQVVFCPPGAEWHYRFFPLPTWGGVFHFYNESIKYTRDSIIANDTLKLLAHNNFYVECNENTNVPTFTLIKQKGDTVFFKNFKTQNNWQILYNFACQPGSGWQTTVLNYAGVPLTYSFVVSSVSYTTINNFNLKQLNISGAILSERFGWDYFLFRYFSGMSCDGYYYYDRLCYQDNAFGVKQFGDKACDFSGIDGVEEYGNENVLRTFPNPVSGTLNVELNIQNPAGVYFRIVNALGEEILTITETIQDEGLKIDLGNLENGIYFLHIFESGKFIAAKK
jgi:hypothetical protein